MMGLPPLEDCGGVLGILGLIVVVVACLLLRRRRGHR
jgi:uncharacterized protein (TIGR03382 family)